MPRATLIGLLTFMLLTACESDSTQQTEPQGASEPPLAEIQSEPSLEMCSEEQRPEMCAQFYKPVCGQLKNSSNKAGADEEPERDWKTFGNSCSACADHQVIGHKPGACDELEESKERR